MSIAQLIQAAEWLERREREAEHGYASTMPMPEDYTRRRTRPTASKKVPIQNLGNRSTHNELEKNRRAHLRHCLERLKQMVPLGADSSRHTTLGLLTKAKSFIKGLEDKDRKHRLQKEQLARDQRYLRRRLEQLTEGQYRVRMERSISECSSTASTSSTTSSSSSSATSEPCDDASGEYDEVDILGYGSSESEDTDHSSIRSNSSDGGPYGIGKMQLGSSV